jgi:hypothetical protein
MNDDRDNRILALLEANEKLLQENNHLLRKAERREKWRLVGKAVWLVVIIGLPVWLYFQYLEPTLQSLQNLSQGTFEIPADWQTQMQQYWDNSTQQR